MEITKESVIFRMSTFIDKNLRNKFLSKRIAVLCGGITEERNASLIAGKECKLALVQRGYKAEIVVFDKNIDVYKILKNFDVVFPCAYGPLLEDGSVQGNPLGSTIIIHEVYLK